MNSEKYNGWTNYATWKVNLELVDGYGYEDIISYYKEEGFEGDEAINLLASCIQESVEDMAFEGVENSFAQGAVHSFLSDVNWIEIAEHINENIV